MFSRKRFLAGASAVALAAGTTLAGAGIASAQDGEDTGSLRERADRCRRLWAESRCSLIGFEACQALRPRPLARQ